MALSNLLWFFFKSQFAKQNNQKFFFFLNDLRSQSYSMFEIDNKRYNFVQLTVNGKCKFR